MNIKAVIAAAAVAAASIGGLAACGSTHAVTPNQAAASASAAAKAGAAKQAAADKAAAVAVAAKASASASASAAASAAASKQAAADKAAVAKRAAGVAAAVPTPAPAAPVSNGGHAQSSCGGGIWVDAVSTSCGFAENVKLAYDTQIGAGGGSVSAYSPARGEYFTVYCTDQYDGTVVATGDYNILVYFSK